MLLRILCIVLLLASVAQADGSFGVIDTIASAPNHQTIVGDISRGSVETSDGAGTLDSCHVVIEQSGTAVDIRCALYLESDDSWIDSTEILTSVDIDGTAVLKFDFIGNAAITDATEYHLQIGANGTTCNIFRNFDAGEGPVRRDVGTMTWADPWEDPYVETGTVNNYYVSYTVFWSTASAASASQVIVVN